MRFLDMNELNQFIDIRHTMYIIHLWRISESLGFIWSIPPRYRYGYNLILASEFSFKKINLFYLQNDL